MSDSVRPHRWQPTRLPRPWDSPGKNTGVGCHFLLQCTKVKRESEVTQSCPTLSDPMDCSPPGSSIHGIFQARVLEWGAIEIKKTKTLQNKFNPKKFKICTLRTIKHCWKKLRLGQYTVRMSILLKLTLEIEFLFNQNPSQLLYWNW